MSGIVAGVHSEVTEHPGWRRTLAITVPEATVRAELDEALRRLARGLKLPGFRKGKAPLSVLRRHYGASAQTEVLQRVMESAYRAALAERALQPVSEGEIEDVDYQPDAGLAFRISFDVRPEVALPCLDGFRVARPSATVEAAEVDRAMEALREEHALWRPPDDEGRPGSGDLVTVRIVRADGGEARPAEVGLPWARRLELRPDSEHRGRYQFVLGEGDAVPELEAAVRGLMAGESTEWMVASAEGGDPGAPPARHRVTLENRQVQELPELDDLFAQSLGEFDGVASLRQRLEEDLRQQAAERAELVVRTRLLDAVVDANPFDVPGSMVERFLASRGGDQPVEPRAESERAVKRALVLERIAELFGLHATPDEVDARLADLAQRGQVLPERVRARLVKTGRMDRLVGEITDAKVFDFLERRSRILPEEAP